MAKFPPKGKKKFGASPGPFFHGEAIEATSAELSARRMIPSGRFSKKKAVLRLALLEPNKGYSSRREFCWDIASIVAAYPELARKGTRSRKTVSHHIYLRTDPKNIERYLNDERIRRSINPECVEFLAVGTTGVEGLNAEIRHWFNGIVETHAPILRLKLRIFAIGKLMRFFSAMEDETTTQIKQTHLLSNIVSSWEPISLWPDWCGRQFALYWCKDTKRLMRPEEPNITQREKEDAEALAKWKLKTPQKKQKKAKHPKKHTPFARYKGVAKIPRKNPTLLPVTHRKSKDAIKAKSGRSRRHANKI